MNQYSIFFSLLLVVFGVYIYLFVEDRKNPLVLLEDLGTGSNAKKNNPNPEKIRLENNLLKQKIQQRNIAYYFYLISLAMCFLVGILLAYKLVNSDQNFKLKDIMSCLGVCGGGVMARGFKKLYEKCDKTIKL